MTSKSNRFTWDERTHIFVLALFLAINSILLCYKCIEFTVYQKNVEQRLDTVCKEKGYDLTEKEKEFILGKIIDENIVANKRI